MLRSARRSTQLCDRSHSSAEKRFSLDPQAARIGGWREAGAVGSGLEPQRFADTCGMRCRCAFHRS